MIIDDIKALYNGMIKLQDPVELTVWSFPVTARGIRFIFWMER